MTRTVFPSNVFTNRQKQSGKFLDKKVAFSKKTKPFSNRPNSPNRPNTSNTSDTSRTERPINSDSKCAKLDRIKKENDESLGKFHSDLDIIKSDKSNSIIEAIYQGSYRVVKDILPNSITYLFCYKSF